MKPYDHKKIEKKWQKFWAANKIYTTKDSVPGKDNFYLLVEFPYPSGNLHVGHWYAFAVPDIFARFQRMQGKNVMYPIGFDAFGLPAENAAIKNGTNPRVWTEKNMAYMREQIASMGASFDWSREVVTCDPAYYKWTQWLFLQLHKKGLVYQKETAVNWCPTDKTVLANEQVVDGRCERCGSEVVQRQMLQWNIKITEYADRLIDDLDGLDWPQQIKESQRNWIGRSEGYEIDFPIRERDVKRVVLLHGRQGSAHSEFFPWLKGCLESLGYEVQAPELPNPDEPNDEEQADFVQAHCTLDEHTTVLGHSFGGVVALRLLERGIKVKRTVLVAMPFSGTYLDKKKRPSVTKALKKGFDFDTLKRSSQFALLYDTADKVVPMSDGETLAKELGAYLMRGNGIQSHFTAAQEQDVFSMATPVVRVFTTRADTLYGCTYLVLAPEHPLVEHALKNAFGTVQNADEVRAYITQAKKKTELERQTDQKDKTGLEMKGVSVVNPATGQEISLWVADYVLGHYGTGAVMGVPAHDERDAQFAAKYGIPVRDVIEALFTQRSGNDAVRAEEPFTERNSVHAFAKHWSEDKYLAVRFKPSNINECVTGGIEAGEDAAAAGVREIREETGYASAKFVRPLGNAIHAKYYSVIRKSNMFVHFTSLLYQLENEAREEISQKEREQHDVFWLTKDEMTQFINRDDIRLAWERVDGDFLYEGDGFLTNSGEFSGMTTAEGKRAIGERFGRKKTTYKLRDWIVSRQRYWGVPIPIIHCDTCGAVPVPDKDLPVKLPDVKDYLPDGQGKSPLAKVKKFVEVKCPKCKGVARRETDTLDTFVDSSWYFLRYADSKNASKFADPKKLAKWMPVDLYSGGAEHTTMHVLYSRFWHKALFDMGLVGESEPYTRRMNRSLILGPDGQKMSKSRGNVIDPDAVVEKLGADTVRMYLAFVGPYSEVSSFPWNPDGVVGVRRFLERVWRVQEYLTDVEVTALTKPLHRVLKKIGEDVPVLKFNTAIAQLMTLLNSIEKEKKITHTQWDIFLKILAPFAPHIAEDLWSTAGHKTSVHDAGWPKYDPTEIQGDTVKIAVQINGKTRGETEVSTDADKDAQQAAAQEAVAARLAQVKIIRTIVVPGRLVNFVVEE